MQAKVDSGSSQLSVEVTMEAPRSRWILGIYFDIIADRYFFFPDGLDVKGGSNSGVIKDFNVFGLINWSDREDYRRHAFCRVTQELQTEQASVEISTINQDGKMMGNGSLEGKIRPQIWVYLT